jgi:hypothetical protein
MRRHERHAALALQRTALLVKPIAMTNHTFDWEQLKSLQSRIPLGDDPVIKEVLLQRVVGSKKMKQTVWRGLANISGQSEFFILLNDKIQTTQDLELLARYLHVLAGDPDSRKEDNDSYVQNTQDRDWIHQQIAILRNNQDTQETDKAVRKPSKSKTRKEDSPPAEPPPSPDNDPLRTSVAVTLEGNLDLRKLLSDALFGLNTDVSIDQIADRLLVPQPGSRIEFPLEQLGLVVKGWRNQRRKLSASKFRKSLNTLKEILKIASFPNEDRDRLTKAMRDVLGDSPKSRASVQFTTREQHAVEDLLRETWVRVSNIPCKDHELPSFMVKDGHNDFDIAILREKLKVLKEPTQKNDDKSNAEWYAEQICKSLGYEFQPNNWRNWLNFRLDTFAQDSTVVVMFISQEYRIAIATLKEEFPRLLLLEVSDSDAERYYKVYTYLDDIDKSLANVLVD